MKQAWYIAENDGISCTIRDASDYDIVENLDAAVCEHATPNDGQLIAAAPDLLAALVNLTNSLADDHQLCIPCEDLDWQQRDYQPHHPDCIIGEAKAAIDKAEGIAFDCVRANASVSDDEPHDCYNADQPCGCPCDNCHDDTEFRCKVCNTLIDTQMSAMLTSRSLEICEDCQGGE